ncbi:hypothetical protein BJ742DRAFT_830290 [Cladochytrium replicatum]|nr:hypothetical protein BJ742DRAFT_830290 [Cladochytrium replicatum]
MMIGVIPAVLQNGSLYPLESVNEACVGWPLSDHDEPEGSLPNSPNRGYRYSVYVSYARGFGSEEDASIAEQLYLRLQLHENPPGSALCPFHKRVFFDAEVNSVPADLSLKSSKCVVLLVSQNSIANQSSFDALIKEWETAVCASTRSKCLIFPVLITETNSPKLSLTDLRQKLDPSLPLHSRFILLLDAIAAIPNTFHLDRADKLSLQDCVQSIGTVALNFDSPEFASTRMYWIAFERFQTLGDKVDGEWTSDSCRVVEDLPEFQFEGFTFAVTFNRHWRQLDLTGHSMRGDQMKNLAQAIRSNGKIFSLNLKRVESGEMNGQNMAESLRTNSALQTHLTSPTTPPKSPSPSLSLKGRRRSKESINSVSSTLSEGRTPRRAGVNPPSFARTVSETSYSSRRPQDSPRIPASRSTSGLGPSPANSPIPRVNSVSRTATTATKGADSPPAPPRMTKSKSTSGIAQSVRFAPTPSVSTPSKMTSPASKIPSPAAKRPTAASTPKKP